MYDNIVTCLNNDSKLFIKEKRKQKVRPGWSEYVSEIYAEAKEAFQNWVLAGKVRYGPEFQRKKKANARLKYAVRFIKKNEQTIRANSMARKLQLNDICEFWKEVKIINNSKIPLPCSINGVSGDENIAALWGKHLGEIFICVESAVFKVDEG